MWPETVATLAAGGHVLAAGAAGLIHSGEEAIQQRNGELDMHKFTKLLALAGMMAGALALAMAPNSQATGGGDPRPTPPVPPAPDATCVVSGEVTTPVGDPQTVGHTDYQFNDTTILACTDIGTTDVVEYKVHARGSAWGPLQAGICDPSAHNRTVIVSDPNVGDVGTCEGSATAASWSDEGTHLPSGDKYRYASRDCAAADDPTPHTNKNMITATPVNTTNSSDGWVKFVRVGAETVAWGEFCSGVLKDATFHAELVFTPTGLDDGGEKNGDPNDPRTIYALNGVSTITY